MGEAIFLSGWNSLRNRAMKGDRSAELQMLKAVQDTNAGRDATYTDDNGEEKRLNVPRPFGDSTNTYTMSNGRGMTSGPLARPGTTNPQGEISDKSGISVSAPRQDPRSRLRRARFQAQNGLNTLGGQQSTLG